jgi:hypothetical protein
MTPENIDMIITVIIADGFSIIILLKIISNYVKGLISS